MGLQSLGLRDWCSLGQDLRSLDVEFSAFLGVREVFGLNDLEFPILLGER